MIEKARFATVKRAFFMNVLYLFQKIIPKSQPYILPIIKGQ